MGHALRLFALFKNMHVFGQAKSGKICFQALGIPFLGLHILLAVYTHRTLDQHGKHFLNVGFHIFAHQHRSALGVNDFALLVHHVVILQNVFTNFKVARFNPPLCRFNLFRQHLYIHRNLIAGVQPFNQPLNPLGTEQAHQIIFQRHIKPRRARVALPARTAAQLVVYPA